METSDREWVAGLMRSTDPPVGWEPDAGAASARFALRGTPASGGAWWRWPVWAAALLVLGAVLSPAARAVAQQLWQFLTVPKMSFVRVNAWPEGVPSPQIGAVGLVVPPQAARDVEEASRQVHYNPRLPHSGVLSGNPKLSTTFSVAAGTIVKTADLELALRKTRVADETVPAQWDGARLTLRTSPLVIAEWPDVVLVQSLPLTLSAPPGFDFPAFSALVLQIGGVNRDEAARLARNAGTIPAWLVPVTRQLKPGATIEEVTLNSGTATVVQEPPAGGRAGRLTMLWSVPDRVYLLSGILERQLAIAVANAVQ
jgi:hypothetical protein